MNRTALLLALLFPGTATAQTTVTYLHGDALGSPVASTDEAGNVLWREAYTPFGRRLLDEPAAADNSTWYTGHVEDEQTGLVYAQARYYDPAVGRFMALDPAPVDPDDPRTFNRYAYANNSPYAYVDPDGRKPFGAYLPTLPQGFVDASAGVGDGILSTLTLGLVGGSELRSAFDVDGGVDKSSNIYAAGRIAGTAATLAVNAFGAVPRTLTHFTTAHGAQGIARSGTIVPSKASLFGPGVYASGKGRNLLVPGGSTVPVPINNTAGFVRTLAPNTFLKPTAGGVAQLGAMNVTAGVTTAVVDEVIMP